MGLPSWGLGPQEELGEHAAQLPAIPGVPGLHRHEGGGGRIATVEDEDLGTFAELARVEQQPRAQ